MPVVPSKVAKRLAAGLKQFQPVVTSAKARDVNESDTVILMTDILSDLFGYDKYSELTSELSVKGTSCDLATKLNGEIQFLIEAKAVGTDLRDTHTRQATEYAANEGVDWVVLSNGWLWRVYKVIFGKPVDHELVVEFDLLTMDPKEPNDLETLYLLAKEGWSRSALDEFDSRRQALNRFCIAAMVTSDPLLRLIRRQIRQLSPDVKIDLEQIKTVLEREVLKRDVLEGEKAEEARKKLARAAVKARRLMQPDAPSVQAAATSLVSEPPLPANGEKIA
ncbi:MAG: restriction endonuclease subunit R [Chlamydiota bacterium]